MWAAGLTFRTDPGGNDPIRSSSSLAPIQARNDSVCSTSVRVSTILCCPRSNCLVESEVVRWVWGSEDSPSLYFLQLRRAFRYLLHQHRGRSSGVDSHRRLHGRIQILVRWWGLQSRALARYCRSRSAWTIAIASAVLVG